MSHRSHLFNVLKNNNIYYDIYMHTWKTDDNLIWENKSHLPIDYDEYKLLNPTYYKIDDQDNFLKSINFNDYFNQELYNIYGGDTGHEWRPLLIRNHLCALESLKRVTNMVLNKKKKYNYVIYIRPDVIIHNLFKINFFPSTEKNISIPNSHQNEGYNDTFAIVHYKNCNKYGKRIKEIIEFRKNNGRIVAEKYLKFIIDKYFDNVNFIDYHIEVIRP
jgi:hypothetical protein